MTGGGIMAETDGAVAEAAENAADEKYLIFSILGKYYTVPSRSIGEIALFDTVYPLPLMPDYVLGIVNRYSVPYALFDVGLLLMQNPTPRGKMLVFKDEVDRVAFLIDDVTDIADVARGKLLTVERSADSSDLAELVTASFKWNGSDVFVLDIQRLLSRVAGETAG
jgi:purine-binding chemotaxis protein CheW